MSTQAAKPDNIVVNVHINDVHYKLDRQQYIGAELAALAGIPVGNQLFIDVPGNGDDTPVGADEQLTLRSGMKFYDVPVGNLG